MKLKFLLIFLLLSGTILYGQNDTIRGLVITEGVLFGGSDIAYFEITNMGDETINLGVIEFSVNRPWDAEKWVPNDPLDRIFLPEYMLEPGESYVIAPVTDYAPKKFAEGLDGYEEKNMNDDMWELADLQIHILESSDYSPEDSVDLQGWQVVNNVNRGRDCFFIRQFLNETDSVVLDQINGWFDSEIGGINRPEGAYDIAGVAGASANSTLIRKFSVKEGNLNFADAAGIGELDGEWIVAPKRVSVWRELPWTIGNHGDYKLDDNTLESDVADIDFVKKTITIPWGIRRPDGIMHLMKKKPGILWDYELSPVVEDSLSFACATGDKLGIVVAGKQGYHAKFNIIVNEPNADAKIVVPMTSWNNIGAIQAGIVDWPRVTNHKSGQDTIWGTRGGIPYSTRVDSLLGRLDKPANASWQIIWADGMKRPDLEEGDLLRITAQDGSIKEYYISVLPLRANKNADLTAITWPDIPAFYRGILGWIGDTIPGFVSSSYGYRVSVPNDVDGIPALVATKSDPNAKVTVQRAKNLGGTMEDRTIKFTVQAEDDTTFRFYNVELVKEKNPNDVQPYYAEPFLSQYVWNEQYMNGYVEICNPGNQPLDLSNYMFVLKAPPADPAAAVKGRMSQNDWLGRYEKYVPGYKWVGEDQWKISPGILERDLKVNSIVLGGDVFCMGAILNTRYVKPDAYPDYVWPIPAQLDVQFLNHSGVIELRNPWNEAVNGNCVRKGNRAIWYMFKILNDSIKEGLKPASDPNDFELLDVWGMVDGTRWVIGGKESQTLSSWSRKPEIYEPNPVFEASFGTNEDDSEWIRLDADILTSGSTAVGYPWFYLNQASDIGQHYFYTPTHYMSTVSSLVYKVSEGFGRNGTVETIRGMTPEVTANDFLSNIIKANEGQTLTIKSVTDGSVVAMDALLSNMDTLIVMSADSTNMTKYELEVNEQGLSSNAVLTSTKYKIAYEEPLKSSAEAGEGTITGIEYGTTVRTVINNVTVPAGALLDIVDGNGAYIPLKILNYDTTYVDVTVNNNIYFDVVAENGVTRIVYQLVPEVSQRDAFITSDLYSVIQKDFLIKFVPGGIDVESFLANLVPSAGATMRLINKMGQQRIDGYVVDDDKVIVTSSDGTVTNVYHISRLSTKSVKGGTYLAYILSAKYHVDQVNYNVTGVSGNVTQFLTNITPAPGATAIVVDGSGNVKASGNIEGGDMVKVTSADGNIVVLYDLTTVSAGYTSKLEINLYPNPTNDKINIMGVETGYRIRVYNTLGVAVHDIKVQNSTEIVSLNDQPAGLYLIVVSDDNKALGKFKAFKK